MVRTVIPFLPPAQDAEAEAFVAERLREEQGGPAAANAGPREIEAVWDALGQIEAADFAVDDARTAAPRGSSRRAWLAGGALAASVAMGGLFLWNQQPTTYETRVGERRTIALPDGSQVTLNTASRIETRFDGRRREVVLLAGEAFFAVRRQPDHAAFDVFSHAARVRVIGTRFNVHRHAAFTDVDLLEGRVMVGPANTGATGSMELAPGQAVRVSASGLAGRITGARAGRIEDWRNGVVSFDATPLKVAVAEMNRYSGTPIRLDGAALDHLRVDGVFETGDTAAFARALHSLNGVVVRRDGETWRLSSPPGSTEARQR